MTEPLALDLTPEVVAELSGGQVDASNAGLPLRIAGALSDFRRYCGWHVFPNHQVTTTLETWGQKTLQLPSLNVTGVSKVELKIEHQWSEVVAAAYEWNRTGKIQLYTDPTNSPLGARHPVRWTSRLQGARIEYESGFPMEDVAHLLISLSTAIARSCTNPSARTAYAVGGRSESYLMSAFSSLGVRPFKEELDTWNEYKLAQVP